MEVVVTHETHFFMDNSGHAFTTNESGSGYNYFKRYLDVFDSVMVVGRAKLGEQLSNKFPVTGKNIQFFPIPDFRGPYQYLNKILIVNKKMKELFSHKKQIASFIARSPGNMGFLLVDNLLKSKVPYGMEVVSDPFDVFTPGAIKSIWRPIFRISTKNRLKKHCLGAAGISYVTSNSLQDRYPGNVKTYCTNYSSIMLFDEDFIRHSRSFDSKTRYNLIYVGTLEQLYKGPDVLINAVSLCLNNGYEVNLTVVGDGRCRKDLEIQVAKLGIGDRIQFLGRLPSGKSVRERLDEADLFVLPSRGEGLPRAMIEAMARGLPCIGTQTSGIPELLAEEDLVPPNNAKMLAGKISDVLANPDRMSTMSRRNLARSNEYRGDLLQQRRIDFYKHIRSCSEEYFRKVSS